MAVRPTERESLDPDPCAKLKFKFFNIFRALSTEDPTERANRADHSVRVFRGFPGVAQGHVALTIGNFDGVHRGHQAMLMRLTEAAEDLGLPSAVLTFDPHPREFFARDKAPPRLSSVRGKLEQFRAAGVARVYVARFNARTRSDAGRGIH